MSDREARETQDSAAIDGLKLMMDRIHEEQEEEDAEEARNSLGGVPWISAPLPPRVHKCFVQTRGWVGFDEVHRCACGAIRNPRFGGGWLDKNSRAGKLPEKPSALGNVATFITGGDGANGVTMFMFWLGVLLSAFGVGILYLAVLLNPWKIPIGLAWLAFTGTITVYAWRHRHEA